MKINKKKLEGRVAECTGFSRYSISSTDYLHCSFHIFELCWSAFNKIEEIDSRPALYRKKLLSRRFSCEYIRIFSTSSTRFNVSSLFGKIPTLFKRWYTMDLFLKMFFSRQLISGTCSKVYVVKSVYHRATVCTM